MSRRVVCGIMMPEPPYPGDREDSGCLLPEGHGSCGTQHISSFIGSDGKKRYCEWKFVDVCDCGLTEQQIDAGECECTESGSIPEYDALREIEFQNLNRG